MINRFTQFGGSLFYPPKFLAGTYDHNGIPRIFKTVWGGIYCIDPPSYALTLNEQSGACKNIAEKNAFTVNVLPEKYIKALNDKELIPNSGRESGHDRDKLHSAGLTIAQSDTVDAPYIMEALFAAECRLTGQFKGKGIIQFIGEIIDIKTNEDSIYKEMEYADRVNAFMLTLALPDFIKLNR